MKSRIALAVKKQAWRDSLAALAIQGLGYKDVNRHTHGDMISVLESPTKRKLVVMPRGSLKTSLGSVAYPIWLLANNPNLRIMLDSELYTNSKMRVREIREHLDSQRFIQTMGAWRGDVWSDGEITVAGRTLIQKEPSIFASGISASKTGVHADVIIADDLNSPLNTNKKENAAKVIEHVKYYTSILEPNGTIVFIGTRYSKMDIYQNIIDGQLTEEQKVMIENS